MGSVRQSKKRRSSKPKIRQANKLKKPLNPRGNNIVAQNWYVPNAPFSLCARAHREDKSHDIAQSREDLQSKHNGKLTAGAILAIQEQE